MKIGMNLLMILPKVKCDVLLQKTGDKINEYICENKVKYNNIEYMYNLWPMNYASLSVQGRNNLQKSSKNR